MIKQTINTSYHSKFSSKRVLDCDNMSRVSTSSILSQATELDCSNKQTVT